MQKHVTVHVAPPEAPEPRPNRPQQPLPNPDKHYQIIFIKAPTPAQQEGQEIELPPAPEQKTLVYVLLKKPEPGTANFKLILHAHVENIRVTNIISVLRPRC